MYLLSLKSHTLFLTPHTIPTFSLSPHSLYTHSFRVFRLSLSLSLFPYSFFLSLALFSHFPLFLSHCTHPFQSPSYPTLSTIPPLFLNISLPYTFTSFLTYPLSLSLSTFSHTTFCLSHRNFILSTQSFTLSLSHSSYLSHSRSLFLPNFVSHSHSLTQQPLTPTLLFHFCSHSFTPRSLYNSNPILSYYNFISLPPNL